MNLTPANDDDLFTGLCPGLAPPTRTSADWTTERRLWTVSQIAVKLRVGKSTVRSWCGRQGRDRLVAEKTSENGHYRVTATALRHFLGLNSDDRPAATQAA